MDTFASNIARRNGLLLQASFLPEMERRARPVDTAVTAINLVSLAPTYSFLHAVWLEVPTASQPFKVPVALSPSLIEPGAQVEVFSKQLLLGALTGHPEHNEDFLLEVLQVDAAPVLRVAVSTFEGDEILQVGVYKLFVMAKRDDLNHFTIRREVEASSTQMF